jgi:N-succinyldiaminopimelate aminotransferase
MHLNPAFAHLHAYPFEKLRTLLKGVTPPQHLPPITMQIGEPKHPTPQLIKDALIAGFDGLAQYPPTAGPLALREAIAQWAVRRYGLHSVNAETEVLPVLGSKEALFAFVQTVIDTTRPHPTIVMPDPFYQVYEGAALFAGAAVHYIDDWSDASKQPDFSRVPASVWANTQLLFVCSPDNPTGRVLTLDTWKTIFNLADQYGFVIVSDECYSEIYFEEGKAPLGALEAAQKLGRSRERLIVFGSLSKRSNAPGLRSGYAIGDAQLIAPFTLYRTYHGSAMSGMIVSASIAAWNDEGHVRENRAIYKRKFFELTPKLAPHVPVVIPDAAFYWWPSVKHYFGGDDAVFTRELYRATNVTVLPGSYLGRELLDGSNPGRGRIRLALVATFDECAAATERIAAFTAAL